MYGPIVRFFLRVAVVGTGLVVLVAFLVYWLLVSCVNGLIGWFDRLLTRFIHLLFEGL